MACTCNCESDRMDSILVDLFELARSNDYVLNLSVGKDYVSAYINMEEVKGKKKEA